MGVGVSGLSLASILRLAGGDWNSLVGMAGLAGGVGLGCVFLRSGYTLGRSYALPKVAGWMLPGVMVFLLAFLLMKTSFNRGSDLLLH